VPWFVEVTAVVYLGIWFVSQLFSGLLSLPNAGQMGGVAWWAHIGGFVFGALAFRLFTRPRQEAYRRLYPDEYYPN
jgi:membrane associated rhomboid family serine protease